MSHHNLTFNVKNVQKLNQDEFKDFQVVQICESIVYIVLQAPFFQGM